MKLAQLIQHATQPVTASTHDFLFETEDTSKNTYYCDRYPHDLAFTNAIALFMASRPGIPAVACVIHHLGVGHYRVLIAKNNTVQEDETQLKKLIRLCAERMRNRSMEPGDFARSGFENVVVPFCFENIKNRIREVCGMRKIVDRAFPLQSEEVDIIGTVCGVLEETRLNWNCYEEWDALLMLGETVHPEEAMDGFPKWRSYKYSGDQYILEWAQKYRLGLAKTITKHLWSFYGGLEDMDQDSATLPESLNRIHHLTATADRLCRSNIFLNIINCLEITNEMKAHFLTSLRKVAAYFHGLRTMFHILGRPNVAATLPSYPPSLLNFEYAIINARSETVVLDPNWKLLLGQFRTPESIEEICGSVKIPKTMQVENHPEMVLIYYFQKRDIVAGVVGLSKPGCRICCSAIQDRWQGWCFTRDYDKAVHFVNSFAYDEGEDDLDEVFWALTEGLLRVGSFFDPPEDYEDYMLLL